MLRLIRLGAAGFAAALALAVPAHAQSNVAVGTLTCNVGGSVGFIVGSTRDIACRFRRSDGGRSERYVGRIDKFGLDVGVTRAARMVWAVFAPTRAIPPTALAGDYGGASADASVGVGGGAKLLIGGSNRTISLQPLSLQGQTGLNIAVGVSGMSLRPAR